MQYSMTDLVKVPSTLGRYTLSWRWDCEQTPQGMAPCDYVLRCWRACVSPWPNCCVLEPILQYGTRARILLSFELRDERESLRVRARRGTRGGWVK